MGLIRLVVKNVQFGVMGGLCMFSVLMSEVFAQGRPSDLTSKPPEERESQRQAGKPIPFSGLEERLRQSPRWQMMSAEEQAQALEKIGQARRQFLDRQQQLHRQYEGQIKKGEKSRESLMSKRRKREQYQDIDLLWSRFQALPLGERVSIERQLGLDRVLSSRQQQEFQMRLERLSFSKRNHILRQLQEASP